MSGEVGLTARRRTDEEKGGAHAPAGLRWYRSDPPLPRSARPALEKILIGHEPFPALITDSCWNIVALNHTMQLLIDDVAAHLRKPPANFLRIVLHPEGLAPYLSDPWRVRGNILRSVRQWHAMTGDRRLGRLEADLLAYPVVSLGGEGPAEAAPFPCVPIGLWRDGQLLNFFHVVTSFGHRPGSVSSRFGAGSNALDGIALESFLPADAETRAVLDSPGHAWAGTSRLFASAQRTPRSTARAQRKEGTMTTARTAGTAPLVGTEGNDRLLRLALVADAILTGVNGIGYLALATVLDSVLGVERAVQYPIGVFLTVYALWVFFVVRQEHIKRAAALVVITLNALWAVLSIVAAATDALGATGVGTGWVVLQGLVVGAMAALQYVGLRRL